LCCLEGLSRAEAATELGWKEGTVSGRLAQARKQLQKRLVRRGVTLSAALTAIALAQSSVAAAGPFVLIQATVRAGLGPLTGQVVAPTCSSAAVALAEGVLHSMAVGKLNVGLAFLLTLCMLISGAALAAYQLGSATDE